MTFVEVGRNHNHRLGGAWNGLPSFLILARWPFPLQIGMFSEYEERGGAPVWIDSLGDMASPARKRFKSNRAVMFIAW